MAENLKENFNTTRHLLNSEESDGDSEPAPKAATEQQQRFTKEELPPDSPYSKSVDVVALRSARERLVTLQEKALLRKSTGVGVVYHQLGKTLKQQDREDWQLEGPLSRVGGLALKSIGLTHKLKDEWIGTTSKLITTEAQGAKSLT